MFSIENAEEPAETRPRRPPSLWRWLPLIAGVVLFEATDNPILGVVVACLKFGWDDLLTARWLAKTDPDRRRAGACALFQASWGFAKVALTGLVAGLGAVLLIVGLAQGANGAPAAVLRQWLGTWIALFLASFAFLIVSTMGTIAALSGRVKVWIGPEARDAWRIGSWPPIGPRVRGIWDNRVRTVLIAQTLLLLGIAFAASLVLIERRGRPPEAVRTALCLGFFVGLVVVAFAGVPLRKRIVARTARECWPDPSLDAPEASAVR